MRRAFGFSFFSFLLLCLTAQAQQKTNPHTQIAWPASCVGPNHVYNYPTNQCIVTPDITALTPGPPAICPNGTGGALTQTGCTIPAPQVSWPGSCSTGVYSPATNTCVPPGTAANPAGTTGQSQMNAGGIFAPVPGSVSDATLGWKTQGGAQFAKGWQTGGGWNGVVNATANGQTVLADPSYGITTTANMTKESSTFTVANPAGIVVGQVVFGNVAGAPTVNSIVGNTVNLIGGWALTTNAAASVTFYEMPYRLNTFNIPAASAVHFEGQWLGQHTDLKRDPPTNPYTLHQDFNVEGCYTTKHQSWTVLGGTGGAGTNSTCHVTNAWFAAPSSDYGQSMPTGLTNWGVTVASDLDDAVSNKGIGELFGGHHYKSGIGDGPLGYYYYSDYLGSVAGADEGQGGVFIGGGEAIQTYTGTVAAGGGGSGATQLSVTCTIDCAPANGGPGDGRYMIDKSSSPIAYNMVSRTAPSGLIPGTITTDVPIPVSTFWGTLTADVLTPPAVNASGIPFADQNPATLQTFTVASGTLNGVANTGAPHAGDLICFSAPWHEQAIISSVTGSGPWTVKAPIRLGHTANSWMFSNGGCGTFTDFAANDAVSTGGYPAQTQHYPFDILGSTTANTLVYQWFSNIAGGLGFPLGSIYLPAATGGTVTNAGGIVTFNSVTASTFPHYIGQTITISGAANALYNGPCTSVTPNAAGFLTCYQAASINQASSGGSPTIVTSIGTTGYGNTAATLWRGAETLNILDYNEANCNAVTQPAGAAPLHAPCFTNKNITLEPNNAAWADGDAIEQPHHYSSQVKATKQLLALYDPYVQSATNGWNFQAIGQGVSNGGLSTTGNWSQMDIINMNPGSLYAGHGQGGVLTPPGGITLGWGTTAGVGYNYGLYVTNAPEPNGVGRGMYIGCPSSPWLCTDPSYNYKIFEMAGRVNGNYFSYNPYNSDILVGSPNNPVTWNAQNNDINFLQERDNIKFSPMATPAIASPTTATSNGSIPDATTRYYTVVAVSRAGAGTSLPSNEVSQITGSSGSNKNTITITWAHVTGAVQYRVCEGATSGSELLLATLSGVDATFFTDGGGTASGGCAGAGTQPGIDTAGFVKFQSPGGTGVDTVVAASSNSANSTHTLPPTGGTLALGLSIPAGTPTFTPGTNVSSCSCPASNCTNTRGRLTIVGGTATTGTICTITWSSALATVPFVTLGEMGATTLHGLDHGPVNTGTTSITAAVSVSGATINLDYQTQP